MVFEANGGSELSLRDADLDAAVAQGVLTREQVEALRRLLASRQPQSAAERAGEERFRFMLGFNDVFFAIGVVLLGAGLGYFASGTRVGSLIAAVVMWGLAELLLRRRRLVLPGMVLASFFAAFVFRAVDVDWVSVEELTGLRLPANAVQADRNAAWFGAPLATMALQLLVAGGATALFYARFRLPFALLLIAGSLVAVVALVVGQMLLAAAPVPSALVLLACGLAVFATAMSYDLADRERVTRYADCAFWLHLLAAPLIVHSLIAMAAPALRDRPFAMTGAAAAAILMVVEVVTLVAIVIDRRALFVSALTYLGIVIGYAITGTKGAPTGGQVPATLLALGVIVIALGLGWQPARRAVTRLLPAGVLGRLPPVAGAASRYLPSSPSIFSNM